MFDDVEKLALQRSHLNPFIWFPFKDCFIRFKVIKYTDVVCLTNDILFVFVLNDSIIFIVYWTEAYSQPCQISKMEFLSTIVKEWKLLAICEKNLYLRRVVGFWMRCLCSI